MKSFPFYKSLFLFYFLAYNCTFQCRFHLSSKSFLPGAHFTFFSYQKKNSDKTEKVPTEPFYGKKGYFCVPEAISNCLLRCEWATYTISFTAKKKKKKELAEVLTSEQPQKGLCRAFFVCLTYFVRYFSDINSSFRTSEINIRLDRMPKGKVPQKYLELLLLHFEKKKFLGPW